MYQTDKVLLTQQISIFEKYFLTATFKRKLLKNYFVISAQNAEYIFLAKVKNLFQLKK